MSTSRNWRGWEWGRHGISPRKEEKQKGSSSLVCSENQGSSVERTGQAPESTVQVRRWRGPGYDGPWMWHWGAQIPLSKQAAWEAFWARAWQDLIYISERGLWQPGSTDRKGWGGAQRQRFKPRKESEALTHVLIACLKRGWMQLELFHISPHLILPTVRRQVSSFFPFYRREKNGSEVKLLWAAERLLKRRQNPGLVLFHPGQNVFFKSYYFEKCYYKSRVIYNIITEVLKKNPRNFPKCLQLV